MEAVHIITEGTNIRVHKYVAEFAHHADAVEALKEYADTFNVGRVYQDEEHVWFEDGWCLNIRTLCRFSGSLEFKQKVINAK